MHIYSYSKIPEKSTSSYKKFKSNTESSDKEEKEGEKYSFAGSSITHQQRRKRRQVAVTEVDVRMTQSW